MPSLSSPSIAAAHEYAFRHPLIRAVTYESQLKSSRSQLHRQVAAAIEKREPTSVEKNAALIATHLEAADDLHAAFEWHMRAGTWSTHRDITAARMSWQRAAAVADRLPEDDPGRLAMRIAARTLLCATIWRVGGSLADVGFDELRELTTAAGDKRSLAIGMTGLVQMINLHGEFSEAARLASEHVELLESIGDPELIVGLLTVPIVAKWDAGEMAEAMRLSQRAIDLCGRRSHDGKPHYRVTVGVHACFTRIDEVLSGSPRMAARLRQRCRNRPWFRPFHIQHRGDDQVRHDLQLGAAT